MKYFKFLMLFVFVGIFQACPVDDDEILVGTINIVNDSEETIYCGCLFVSENVVNSDYFSENVVREVKIPKKSEIRYSYYKNQFKGNYNNKIWILIFKQSTLDNYSWEEIQEQNIFDARYSFTLEELQAMNWEVVYTGE